jgi:HK97 family phage prohead protease
VYGNVDLGGDSVSEGAFAKTLLEKSEVPILWEHREVIGRGVLTDTETGLVIKGKLTLAVQRASEAYALMKDGAAKGLSIGYQTVKDEWKNGIRHLRELKLHEVSITAMPMNELALVTAIKAGRRLSSMSKAEIQSAVQILLALLEEAEPEREEITSEEDAAKSTIEPGPDHSKLTPVVQNMLDIFKK